MVKTKGTSTKTAYMSNAGKAYNHPINDSRRTHLFDRVRLETGRVVGSLFIVITYITIWKGAGVTPCTFTTTYSAASSRSYSA